MKLLTILGPEAPLWWEAGLWVCILVTIFACIIGVRTALKEKKVKSEGLVARCGHKTEISGSIYDEDKEKGPYTVELKGNPPNYCLDCLKKSIIKCPWCGGPIFPEEPITLYTSSQKDFKIPDGSIAVSTDPPQLIGCGRCADTGADYSGFWKAPGKLIRHKSLLQIAAETGTAVMSNNITNSEELNVLIFQKGKGGEKDKWVTYSRELATSE